MKKLITSLLVISVSCGLYAAETKWNYQEGKVTSGAVTLKDDLGNDITVNAHTQSASTSLSTIPMLIAQGGGGAYDFQYSIELSDGTVASYETTLQSWLILPKADFDNVFTYDVVAPPLMATQNGNVRSTAYVTTNISMITRNGPTHSNTYSCTGTGVGSRTSNGSSLNTYWTEWDSGSACRAWSGIRDGDSAVAWSEPVANISYSLPYGWITGSDRSSRFTYILANDGGTAVLTGTKSASVSMNWLQAYLSYEGVDRMFSYRYTNKTGSSSTTSTSFQTLNEDGTVGSITTGDLSKSRWSSANAAIPSAYNNPIYVLDTSSYLFKTTTGDDEYLIVTENVMNFAFQSDASVVNFLSNIKTKN